MRQESLLPDIVEPQHVREMRELRHRRSLETRREIYRLQDRVIVLAETLEAITQLAPVNEWVSGKSRCTMWPRCDIHPGCVALTRAIGVASAGLVEAFGDVRKLHAENDAAQARAVKHVTERRR